MKTILMLLVFGTSNLLHTSVQEEVHVYICTGPNAYSYHSHRDCRGLNRCSEEVKLVTLEYAKEKNRRPCKICYN